MMDKKQKDRFIMIIFAQCFLLIVLFMKQKSLFFSVAVFPFMTIGTCFWGILEKREEFAKIVGHRSF